MNFLKKLLHYKKYKSVVYSGRGYTQGTGFDIETDKTEILGFSFITDIRVSVNKEWLRDLKERIKDDASQQKRENGRK